MTVRAIDKDGKPMPTTYEGLAKLWRPVTIHSEAEMQRAWRVVERLVGFDLTAEQDEYLDLASTLIEVYEDSRFNERDWYESPLETVKFLLEENDMTASDLGRLLGDRSLGSAVLRGRRQLSKNHIRILCEEFKLDPMAFLRAEPAAKPRKTRRAKPKLRTGGTGAKADR